MAVPFLDDDCRLIKKLKTIHVVMYVLHCLEKCEEEYIDKLANPFPAATRGKPLT